MEYQYLTLRCDCGTEIEVKASIMPGFSDHETVKCPNCKEDVNEIRADMGYTIIKISKYK